MRARPDAKEPVVATTAGSRNVNGVGKPEGGENATKGPTRQLRWQAANPIARWSHVAVASALRRGILTKPDRCEGCQADKPLDAHHDDHERPLAVRWWCRACHVQHHARQRKAVRHA